MACRGCSSGGCGCSVTGDGSVIAVSGTGVPVTDPYVIGFDLAAALDAVDQDTTDCTLLDDPHVPVHLGDGTVKMVPLPCYDDIDGPVSGNAFPFTWTGDTAEEDPGTGYLGFNSATYSLVTAIHVSTTEANGSNVTAWLDSLDDSTGSPKGAIRVYSRTDPTVWAVFTLTSISTPEAGMRKLVVTYKSHSGAFDDTVIGDIVMDFSPSADGSTGGFNSIQTIATVSSAYTFVLADVGKYIRAGSASPFTLTVPTNADEAIPVGAHIDIIATGAGLVSVAGDTGVTVNGAPGLDLNGQWASATLIKVGTDEWDLVGNLTA